MTDPQNENVPSLEDELLGDPADEPADRRVRTEPIIRTPAAPPWERFRVDRGELYRLAAGFATFLFIDVVMMYGPLMGRNDGTVLPQFFALLVVAFGLGGMFVWHIRGGWRPYGAGLMLGWVFLTLISAGFLTGVMR
ncbi:MAG TPA: hypothetical protein VHJ17_26350 [Thermomonospora sp.]|nr:hypothetical protein [Thermomonospora sp.]